MVLDAAFLDRRAARLTLAAALLAAPLPALAQENPDLYVRVERRIAADPALAAALGKPTPEMASVEWLKGSWIVESVVGAGAAKPAEKGESTVSSAFGGIWLQIDDVYPGGTRDRSYLGYSPASGHWTSASIDGYGNAVITTAAGWQGNRLVFEGDVLVLGEKAHLRQTMTRIGPDEYRIDNAERLGGKWKPLDSYRYTRKR